MSRSATLLRTDAPAIFQSTLDQACGRVSKPAAPWLVQIEESHAVESGKAPQAENDRALAVMLAIASVVGLLLWGVLIMGLWTLFT